MNTKFIRSPDQTCIAYYVNGVGPALMLLHGGGGSRQEWHAGGYVERLRKDFKVITVDLRGHGESDKPLDPACYSTEKMGQDCLAVADACGVENFILWGYSFGGNASRYLAARSDRVARMILIGTHFGAGVSGEGRQMALDFRRHWIPVVHRFLKDRPNDRFDPRCLSLEDQEEIERLSFPAEMLPAVLAWSSAMLDWPVNEPADMRCPTLWIIGSLNEGAMESYNQYSEALDGTRVQVQILEGFTHEQEFDDIDRVLPVLLAFSL